MNPVLLIGPACSAEYFAMHRATVEIGYLGVSVPAGGTLFQKWEKQ